MRNRKVLDQAISSYNRGYKFYKQAIIERDQHNHQQADFLFKEANERFIESYFAYDRTLEAVKKNQEPGESYCEVGKLQCEFMLGTTPLLTVKIKHLELKAAIKKWKDEFTAQNKRICQEWSDICECETILQNISDTLQDPSKTADYACVGAVKINEALFASEEDEETNEMPLEGKLAYLLQTIESKSEGWKKAVNYMHSIASSLTHVIDENRAEKQTIINCRNLLANFYEHLADAYMKEVLNPDNQAIWALSDDSNNHAYHALRDAKRFYEYSIEEWKIINPEAYPDFDLYISTLYVCFTAKEFVDLRFISLREYQSTFKLETALAKYDFAKIISSFSDPVLRAEKQAEYDSYNDLVKEPKSDQGVKRLREEDEVSADLEESQQKRVKFDETSKASPLRVNSIYDLAIAAEIEKSKMDIDDEKGTTYQF